MQYPTAKFWYMSIFNIIIIFIIFYWKLSLQSFYYSSYSFTIVVSWNPKGQDILLNIFIHSHHGFYCSYLYPSPVRELYDESFFFPFKPPCNNLSHFLNFLAFWRICGVLIFLACLSLCSDGLLLY
ncbi:hypothetical protein HanPI659440_Chr13g0496161 [Helianthus annuus]|nr:hypothetical protein HanPI659440_Chr13g0496161 [Helianthus annuus]